MAFVSITYTPEYLGSHNFCIKSLLADDYCCITIDGGDPIGVPVTKIIDLEDTDFTCTITPDPCGETFKAYIYPSCEAQPVGDPDDIFSVTFPLDPINCP